MEMGADGVVLGGRPESVEEIRALLGGAGADVVFETAGSPKTASMTVDVLQGRKNCHGGQCSRKNTH